MLNQAKVGEVGVRVGSWRLIEPHIPEPENRIARQRALFLADYNVRDLAQIATAPIYFYQHDGDAYEDPLNGIDETSLLEARTSRLARLADRVREGFTGGRSGPRPLHQSLTRVMLPGTPVIGSSGAQLGATVQEAGFFFTALVEATAPTPDLVVAIADVFSTYFSGLRLFADVGETPVTDRGEPERSALNVALARLAELADVPKSRLEALVSETAPRDDPTVPGPTLAYSDGVDVVGESARIVASCALYLAGWEHLAHVHGWRARAHSQVAREVLTAWRTPWIPD